MTVNDIDSGPNQPTPALHPSLMTFLHQPCGSTPPEATEGADAATKIAYSELLKAFWESHDPTQGMRQGGDVGTQYRSGIYVYDAEQRAAAEGSLKSYGERLKKAGHGAITTEIKDVPEFYYAEDYHQQYLHKNPGGYCGLGGCGVSYEEPVKA